LRAASQQNSNSENKQRFHIRHSRATLSFRARSHSIPGTTAIVPKTAPNVKEIFTADAGESPRLQESTGQEIGLSGAANYYGFAMLALYSAITYRRSQRLMGRHGGTGRPSSRQHQALDICVGVD
jgi:hypothetical protein